MSLVNGWSDHRCQGLDIAVDADADALGRSVLACALPADSNGREDVHDDADGDLLALGDGERNFGGLNGH